MNNEKVCEILNCTTDLGYGVVIEYESTKDIFEALDTAIKALNQPQCEKCLCAHEWADKHVKGDYIELPTSIKDVYVEVPIITQENKPDDEVIDMANAMGYREGYKQAVKDHNCYDAVSRQAVNDLYDRYHPTLATCVYEFGEELKALPSVNPTREHGEWIEEKHGYRCNKCNRYYKGEWSIKNNAMMPHKYCPNCGAKMESEGKEC